MSRFKDTRADDTDSKLEMIIKTTSRTDSYLNSANTKSTILLSLSSALIAAILLNYDKFFSKLTSSNDKVVFTFFTLTAIVLLFISLYFSIRGITPFIKHSAKENIFSFVDIKHFYNNHEDYKKSLIRKTKRELINELSSLNYNLSGALIDKYKSQKNAIEFIISSLFSMFAMILVILLSQVEV